MDRELASQIFSVLKGFLDALPEDLVSVLSASLLIGGTSSVAQDLAAVKSKLPTILIGTPGRLHEIISASKLNMKSLELLIMDEADRLLDMGFKESLSGILQSLPKQRRTGLFSATMTEAVSELVRTGLRNPVRVVVKVTGFKKGVEKRTPARYSITFKHANSEFTTWVYGCPASRKATPDNPTVKQLPRAKPDQIHHLLPHLCHGRLLLPPLLAHSSTFKS